MEDWQALTSKEKDSHFSNVILATFSRQLLLAISPFVLLFLYTILSIIIKGDTKEGYFTAKQLLFMSVLSVFIVIGYLKASNSHFEDLIGLKLSLSRKKAFYSLAEGMLLVLMYLVVILAIVGVPHPGASMQGWLMARRTCAI